MGEFVRTDRAFRFIREFAADVVPRLSLAPGMQLQVKSIDLRLRNVDDSVMAYATLQGVGGLPEVVVEIVDACLFDVEYDGEEDAVEAMATLLSIDPVEVRERFYRAGLFER